MSIAFVEWLDPGTAEMRRAEFVIRNRSDAPIVIEAYGPYLTRDPVWVSWEELLPDGEATWQPTGEWVYPGGEVGMIAIYRGQVDMLSLPPGSSVYISSEPIHKNYVEGASRKRMAVKIFRDAVRNADPAFVVTSEPLEW